MKRKRSLRGEGRVTNEKRMIMIEEIKRQDRQHKEI
jgi:hypothetical protein